MIDDVPDRWTVNRQMPPADVLAANSLSDGIQGLVPAIGNNNGIFRTCYVQDILWNRHFSPP